MSEEIKVKKIKKIAETDTNEIKVKKVKKVKQIDQQCIKENENFVFCGIDFAKENTKDVSIYELNNEKSDCEKTDNFDFFIQPLNEVVPSVKKIKKVVENVEEVVDIGEEISFTRVTDLDPKKYEDFTKEKFPYGAIFFDYEVFPYDWCVTLTDVVNNKKTVIVNDRKNLVKFYYEHKDEIWIGYNNRNYDNTINKGIILGMNPKIINDKIIVDRLKAFQISDKMKDVNMKTFDCTMLGKSLKQLEGFLQMNIEETEVPFDLPRHLNEKEWEQTLFYNNHDVESTIEVFRKGQIKVYTGNMDLINLYNFDSFYINKTQAQLTEEIIGCEKPKEPRNDDWDLWIIDTIVLNKYKFVEDWFMSLRNDHDRCRIEKYVNGKFIDISKPCDRDKKKYELHVDVCGVEHIFALGGVHGARKNFEIKKEKGIYHSDINSLYPSEMIQYKLLTRNATKPEKYDEAYKLRIKYKNEGNPLNKVLKIPLNGAFGKMGDVESSAYDPLYVKMVPITGQLHILSLLEKLEPYIFLIQSNTDGIIYTINNEEQNKDIVFKIISDWEKFTRLGFTTDTIDYLIEKDVNNYYFRFSNGEDEVKGSYLKNTNDLDNDCSILNECMREYLKNKINIEDYINNCDEFWKFMKIFKVSGDYKFTTHNDIKSTNKCYRVFASKDLKDGYLKKWKYDIGTILETVNSKGEITKRKYEGEKFAGQSDHVFIENGDIHGKKCSEYPKLDKQWYINEVYDRLEDFGINARPDIFDF